MLLQQQTGEKYKDPPLCKSIMDMQCLLETFSKQQPNKAKAYQQWIFKSDKAELQQLQSTVVQRTRWGI